MPSSNLTKAFKQQIISHNDFLPLILSGKKLIELPIEVTKLINLRILYLKNNHLTDLPKEFSLLKNLQILDLSDNSFQEVPQEIGYLNRLQTLYLQANKIISLSKEFAQLNHLEYLNLEENSLSEIPPEVLELKKLQYLDIGTNQLTAIPQLISQLKELRNLILDNNQLNNLPDEIATLENLEELRLRNTGLKKLPVPVTGLKSLELLVLSNNELKNLPSKVKNLKKLQTLDIRQNRFSEIPLKVLKSLKLINLNISENTIQEVPPQIGELLHLQTLLLRNNSIKELPFELSQLRDLNYLNLDGNPLNSDLKAAYAEGLEAVFTYLKTKKEKQVVLNEAKIILVGEGEVGKTCLMDALEDLPWQVHESTHGIKIRPIFVTAPDETTQITLNGWDFGGQRVYRPTHQLFFSPNAVYLVVWKPRAGTQQGMVTEWIRLIQHREPDAKIIVVATHGGPDQRRPDIDRQELWDLFSKNTVIDFITVDSKPDDSGTRTGITELKKAIAEVAWELPEMGRSISEKWQNVRERLANVKEAYLPLHKVFAICAEYGIEENETRIFLRISHRLGHLIHYEYDLALQDLVVLKPDWLATAISFVFDDDETRKNGGLITFERLSALWDNPSREFEERYPKELHKVFLALMERFDLSYQVADHAKDTENPTSLIAQLVQDNRDEQKIMKAWTNEVLEGNIQQVQICKITDEKGNSANAEGLFYQLIVILHRYSLGRNNYEDSVHWQRGLFIDANYNGRALLEHIGNDVKITVRAPYPERLLSMLTEQVKVLVNEFWEGLNCDVMVPCISPCGRQSLGTGLYKVEQLIESKAKNRPEFPCPVCNEWQNIDALLRNAPAARPDSAIKIFEEFEKVKSQLSEMRLEIMQQDSKLDSNTQLVLSRVDETYSGLLKTLTDEAKDGPRLFSFAPANHAKFDPKKFTTAKFKLTLWCEHSHRPLPELYGDDSKGVYEVELTKEWFAKTAPYLKAMTRTLSLASFVLPVATAGIEFKLDDTQFDAIDEQLKLSEEIIDASKTIGESSIEHLNKDDMADTEQNRIIRASGASLRQLHAILKKQDPTFAVLERVQTKQNDFLWVYPEFTKFY